ncbi:MAG: hypothetical protein ACK5P7_13830 [Bdellovibrio sp.]
MKKIFLVSAIVWAALAVPAQAKAQAKFRLECSLYNTTRADSLLIVKWPMEILREDRELMGVDATASETIQINKRLKVNVQITLIDRKSRAVNMVTDFQLQAANQDPYGTINVRTDDRNGQTASGAQRIVRLPLTRSVEFSYPFTDGEDADSIQNPAKYPSIFEVSCR